MKNKLQIHNELKDWRVFFPDDLMEKAKKIKMKYRVELSSVTETCASVELCTSTKYPFHVKIDGAPRGFEEEWDPKRFSCDCTAKRRLTVNGQYVTVCQHEAAVLLTWEEQHGPWQFPEPPEAREERLKAEQAAREALERERKAEAELYRQEKEAEKHGRHSVKHALHINHGNLHLCHNYQRHHH